MSKQCRRVLEYLELYGSITQFEALRDLGIMRLAARIFDLRSKWGIPIEDENVHDVNRMGEPMTYKRYKKVA